MQCLKSEIFVDRFGPERLIGVLVDHDAVEEVFADATDATRALAAIGIAND